MNDHKQKALKELADIIKQKRKKSGMSIRDIERRTGVSDTYITLIEKETSPSFPSENILRRLANEFKIPLSDLLDLKEKFKCEKTLQ